MNYSRSINIMNKFAVQITASLGSEDDEVDVIFPNEYDFIEFLEFAEISLPDGHESMTQEDVEDSVWEDVIEWAKGYVYDSDDDYDLLTRTEEDIERELEDIDRWHPMGVNL